MLLLLSGCGNKNLNDEKVKDKMNTATLIKYSSNMDNVSIDVDLKNKKDLIKILTRSTITDESIEKSENYYTLLFKDEDNKDIYSIKFWDGFYFYFNKNFYKIQNDDMEDLTFILNNKAVVGKEFIRTYTIKNVEPSNDSEYVYITIRSFQDEEVQTVKVKSNLIDKFENDKSYEFRFKIKSNYIQNNISSIFESCEIINISVTNKEGLKQINEAFNS